MYQASHYELVASAEAIKAGHEINPKFQIGCMIAMCPIYPATCRPEDILQAEKAMQKRYYYTDVHVKGEYPVNILNRRRSFSVKTGLCRLYRFQLLYVFLYKSRTRQSGI